MSQECKLPDVQNRIDERGIALERVGVTGVMFPTSILRKDGGITEVSATVKLFAALPKEAKGHNLSRFMETLIDFGEKHKVLSDETLPFLLSAMQERLVSDDVYAHFEFDYYLEKEAPVSKKKAPMGYKCAFTGLLKEKEFKFFVEVNVVAASLCPCSREMSLLENLNVATDLNTDINPEVENQLKASNIGKSVGMGAHNQRSLIKVECLLNTTLWIEDLIPLVEEQASAPTYPILKRPDEKFVTELAYKNPKFSEDIARDVQLSVEKQQEIKAWSLKVENEESIHPYSVTVVQKSDNWNSH